MYRTAIATSTVVLVLAAFTSPAPASPALMVKAKQGGFPAQNCQYCHVSKMPKKEEFKPEDLTERGQWLRAEKAKQAAGEINVQWLKDYPGK